MKSVRPSAPPNIQAKQPRSARTTSCTSPPSADAPASPTFHEFASAWLEAHKPELREGSSLDYSWQLCNHVLPFFHRHRLPQITVAEVDR